MHKRYARFTGIALLCLQGCVRVPQHEIATQLDSAGCQQSANEALDTGQFIQGEWPRENWWEDFEDPVLTALVETSIKESPTLKKAEARFKAAAQFALQKKAALYPEMDLDASTNWQHLSKEGFFRAFAPTIPAVVNDIYFGLSFNYEFDFWGKNRAAFEAALGLAAALIAERKQAELMVTTSIVYQYAELQFLLRKQKLLTKKKENRQEIASIRLKRQEAAVDNALIRLRADGMDLDTQTFLLEIEQQIQRNIHQIKALSGMGQDASLVLEYRPLRSMAFSLPENLSLDLIARRPDLAAQKARIESASRDIHIAKTDFYPNINLLAFLGYESIHWSSLFNRKNYSGSLAPAIHLPIFTAGRLRAQLKEKVAEFNAAVFDYNELILKAAQEVADHLTDLALLQKQIDTREASRKIASEQEKLTLNRYINALDDQMAWLHAQDHVLDVELLLAELDYGKHVAGILLIRSLGGGYHGGS